MKKMISFTAFAFLTAASCFATEFKTSPKTLTLNITRFDAATGAAFQAGSFNGPDAILHCEDKGGATIKAGQASFPFTAGNGNRDLDICRETAQAMSAIGKSIDHVEVVLATTKGEESVLSVEAVQK